LNEWMPDIYSRRHDSDCREPGHPT
jgi:hypothetical protein